MNSASVIVIYPRNFGGFDPYATPCYRYTNCVKRDHIIPWKVYTCIMNIYMKITMKFLEKKKTWNFFSRSKYEIPGVFQVFKRISKFQVFSRSGMFSLEIPGFPGFSRCVDTRQVAKLKKIETRPISFKNKKRKTWMIFVYIVYFLVRSLPEKIVFYWFVIFLNKTLY